MTGDGKRRAATARRRGPLLQGALALVFAAALWPAASIGQTTENAHVIGVVGDEHLYLTGDQYVVDIVFEVVWVADDLDDVQSRVVGVFELVEHVARASMREIVAGREFVPLLNQGRTELANDARGAMQRSFDAYGVGLRVVRVTLRHVDPPRDVLHDFRAVQAAEQDRETMLMEAERYAGAAILDARSRAADLLDEAEADAARHVAAAREEVALFNALLAGYRAAPDETSRRLYVEALRSILD